MLSQGHSQHIHIICVCLMAAGETGPRNMAVVDIVRDRERGMVRYNQARRQYGLRPLADFEDINGRNNSPEGKKARCQFILTS